MKTIEKQRVLQVLDGLDVMETNEGEDAYILVKNSEKHHKLLNDVGVSSETINKYGDNETFCILSLAFGEGYCDLYERGRFIAFDKSVEIDVGGKSVIFYTYKGDIYLTVSEDSGRITTTKLTNEQLQKIKDVIG